MPIKTTCNEDQYKLILDFAKNSVQTSINEYARRNQKNVDKIIQDIIIGKTAEYAVYNYIKSKGKNCSEPDIKIYQKNEKSFDADLYSNNNKIHVKAQSISSSMAFGESWSFQKNDSLTFKPSSDDFICLCIVDGLQVDIKSFKNASFYLDKYKDPILDKLKGIKKVIYNKDIND